MTNTVSDKYELKALHFLQSANVQFESSNKPVIGSVMYFQYKTSLLQSISIKYFRRKIEVTILKISTSNEP